MTAYGAVNSLRNTIDYILHSSHFILVDPSPRILQLAYEELNPLLYILEKLDSTRTSKSRKKVNALDGRIKDLIWEFEDLLESPLYQQILSQVEDEGIMKEGAWGFQGLLESLPSQSRSLEVGGERIRFSIDLQFLQHHVPSFIQRLKDMKKEYTYEVDNMPEDDDDQSISSRSETKSKMIGLSDQFQQLKASLMKRSYRLADDEYIAIHGTAGIGKTTLAAAVFEDPDILSFYEYRAWVSVGRKSQFDEVSRSILAQMFGITQGDGELVAYLKRLGKSKKCLVVLDDVWEKQITDSLKIFLLQINWCLSVCILVTTRDTNTTFPSFSRLMMVRFLKEEESKELLCEKVFGENDCPFQLEKATTKIAKKCEGLPLMIVTVANILSKSQNIDPKYWDDVAEKRNSVFIDAYNEISKGPKWEAQEGSFLRLKFLLIEDSDLVQWIPRSGGFPDLMCLSMKHCYKLEVIDWPSQLKGGRIELVNCNPLALTCAKKLRPDRDTFIDVTASFSFDEKPITIKFTRRHDSRGYITESVGETTCSPSTCL